MKKFTYLIIGGGITAVNAVKGIRENDKNGSIGILTREAVGPYKRPPLSKDLWNGKSVDEIWLPVDDPKTEVLTGQEVVQLNIREKQVSTKSKEVFEYKSLLLATGADPKRLPFSDNEIIYYRNYADYLKLHELAKEQDSFAVIGAGFIGSEIAAALAMNGKKVYLIESGAGIGWRVFPQEIVEHLNELYRSKGVEVLERISVKNVKKQGEKHQVLLKNGKTLLVDGVVSGVGVSPNSELADKAGIFDENGIKVNSYLETSAPDIFAAGDVATFHSPALDKTLRVEHNDNAKKMGMIAGLNMAGGNQEYDYLPMFYSDLFDVGYEAVGLVDARLDHKVIWKEEYKKGIIYYQVDNFIKGVLLWNEWEKVDTAREIIRKQKWIDEKDFKKLI